MNRQEAMTQLGDTLGVAPLPTTIAGFVETLGGTRGVAILMGADPSDKRAISSAQRTVQRYLLGERGDTSKQARGTTPKAHARMVGNLRDALANREKRAALRRRPEGFSARVRGDFFKSHSQKGRAVKPVQIDAAGMESIIDNIQAGDYEGAASAFDDAYGASYDVPGMSWGEPGSMADDAFDSLEID